MAKSLSDLKKDLATQEGRVKRFKDKGSSKDIISKLQKSADKIKSEKAYRLRGMATDSEFQRKGYAKKLMIESLRELKGKGCDLLWCNARLVAIEFYQSLGFKTLGNIFDVEDIGPHYYMHKEIAK